MTRDDIIRMAREAGLESIIDICDDGSRIVGVPDFDKLERFAALVEAAVIAKLPGRGYYHEGYEAGVAAEREKVAKWMIQRSYATGHGDTIGDLLAELDWQIAENWNRAMIKGIETEREACAKVVEEWITHPHLAMAIRARGDALAKLNQAAEANGEEL